MFGEALSVFCSERFDLLLLWEPSKVGFLWWLCFGSVKGGFPLVLCSISLPVNFLNDKMARTSVGWVSRLSQQLVFCDVRVIFSNAHKTSSFVK